MTYGLIFRCKRAFIAFILCIVAITCMVYIDPILSVRLTYLGMSEENVGFAFAIVGFAFGFGSFVGGWLCEKFSRLIIMQSALFLLVISELIGGPSLKIGLPVTIWLMMTGIFFINFFGAFLFVPVAPEIIDSVASGLKSKWTKDFKNLGKCEEDITSLVEEKYNLVNGELVDKANAI